MKSKLYRVLVVLLAVAMMIPSFALAAEDAGKVTLTSDAKDVTWTLAGSAIIADDTAIKGQAKATGFTYTLENTTKANVYVKWASSDATIVKVGSASGNSVPALTVYDIGEATITGTAWDRDLNQAVAGVTAVSFKVTAKEKVIENIKLDQEADSFIFDSTSKLEQRYYLPAVAVEPAAATYGVEWELVEGQDCGSLTVNNYVIVKAAGTMKLRAKALGTSTKTADFTLTIQEKGKDEKPAPAGFTTIEFVKTNKYEVTDSVSINVGTNKYLRTYGPENCQDTVMWMSSDESIATVDTWGNVTFNKNVDEAEVQITAYSKIAGKNGNVKDTITIKYVKQPTNVYKTIKLNKTEEIKYTNDYAWTWLTATVTPLDKMRVIEDELQWTSSDPQVVHVGSYDNLGDWITTGTEAGVYWVPAMITEEKTFTITVRSVNGDAKATYKLTIKPVTAKDVQIRTVQKTITLKYSEPSVDLANYVDVLPMSADLKNTLTYTSDNPNVAVVNGTVVSVANGIPGTAKITVRCAEYPDATPATITINHEKEALKTVKFVNAPTKLDISAANNSVYLRQYLQTEPAYYADQYANELVWDSSDPQIAYFDKNLDHLVVTAKKTGNVTISVVDKDGKAAPATCSISVVNGKAVTAISLKNITLKIGESVTLDKLFYSITPVDGVADIHFVSFNRDVAEVQATTYRYSGEDADDLRLFYNNKLVAYTAGTTTITATAENLDGSKVTGECTVTVIPNDLERVQMSNNKLVLKLTANKQSAKVRFNLVPFDAVYEEGDLYAETADSSIVTVGDVHVTDGKGYVEVYGLKAGTAWVSIRRTKDDVKLDATKVVVQTVKVEKVSVEKKNITLYWYDDGTEYQARSNTTYQTSAYILPIVKPSNAWYSVEYETSDPSVAFIKRDYDVAGAQIIATGAGKATITIKVDDGKKVRTAKVNVTVEGKTPTLAISETKATIKMVKGGDNTLKLSAFNADTGATMKVKWASSDTSVAKVNANGKVTAVGEGKATITATTKTGPKQVVKCKITVKAAASENKIKVTGKEKVTVKVGKTKALNIKVKPAGTKVTYTSTNTKIVKVTKTGKIKGIKAGTATIKVKTADGKVIFKVKVTVK